MESERRRIQRKLGVKVAAVVQSSFMLIYWKLDDFTADLVSSVLITPTDLSASSLAHRIQNTTHAFVR